MTTTEAFIADCLYEQRSYDVFATMEKNPQHILASDIGTPVRVKVSGVDGWVGSPLDCYCIVSLYSYGKPLCLPHTTQHSIDPVRLSWEEWVKFPITYAELPLDTLVCVDVYDPEQGHVGGTSAYLFTARGKLKRGFRRYRISRGVKADGNEDSNTVGRFPTAPWEDIAQEFQMRRIPAVPWMDKLTTVKLNELSVQRPLETHEIYLLMEFAVFTYPVFYSSELLETNLTPIRPGMDRASDMLARHMPYYDPDFRTDNPCEHMNQVLSKATHRLLDADVKPDLFQLRRLQEIISSPPIHAPFTSDQITLLWQFGNFLVRDPAAFVPFMEVVDWKDERESHDAAELAQKWVPISRGDTLSLLSRNFQGVSAMRRHGVLMLRGCSDDDLSVILLQLVQGIRYEAGTDEEKAEGELTGFLIERCCKSFVLTCKMYWYVVVEMSLGTMPPESGQKAHLSPSKVYERVLDRLYETLNSQETGRIYYAQIKRQDEMRKVLQRINTSIRASPDRTKQMDLLKKFLTDRSCGLHELFEDTEDGLGKSLGTSSGTVGTTARFHLENVFERMQGAAREMVRTDAEKQAIAEERDGYPSHGHRVPLYHPLRPDFPVGSIDPTKHYIFKSAKRPIGLWFKTPGGALDTAYGAIYKSGDDIRQDQLVIQMVELMDRLLKDDGLDLKLTPYRVLALSWDDGFVETVPDVDTLQNIGQAGGVLKHLTKNGELDPSYHENFINSCAGYCVITYLLGIGDRHLENLLITKDGRLLHIDFGFILGKDPKPFPAPMKLSREMIEGLGGLDSKTYEQFKLHCCSAYNTIRKHASLLMNLLILMLDASIPQLSGDYKNADPKLNLLKVQDKLRLDLNNAEATQYIQQVITESANALFSGTWDRLHELATKLRT